MEITSTSAAWSSVCCKIHQLTRTLFFEHKKSFIEGYIVSRTEESHSAVKKIQQASQNVASGSVCGRNKNCKTYANVNCAYYVMVIKPTFHVEIVISIFVKAQATSL